MEGGALLGGPMALVAGTAVLGAGAVELGAGVLVACIAKSLLGAPLCTGRGSEQQ